MRSLRLSRAAAQLLHRPGGLGAPELVRRLLAVQAQDLRSARLALRARSEGLNAADVDAALTEERSLVVAWLFRGTLHLVHRDDYPWLLALTASGRLTSNRRRLGQEGISADAAERAVAAIERALVDEGPLTRQELEPRMGTRGQATPSLLMLAVLRGVAVLGPVRDGKQAFALTRDWLGEPAAEPDRDAALAELARRYLAAHHPADAADLAHWSGLGLRAARAGLGAAKRPDRDPSPDRIPPRLLPAFDPYMLGWKERAFAVPGEHARRVHPGGGMLRATATVDGLAVGTWTKAGIELFDGAEPSAFESELADVARFEGA